MKPSLFERAVSFCKTAGKSVLRGCPQVPKNVYKERLAICDDCESFDKQEVVCNECGCYMFIKAKMAGEDIVCPLGKWESYPPKTSEETVSISST